MGYDRLVRHNQTGCCYRVGTMFIIEPVLVIYCSALCFHRVLYRERFEGLWYIQTQWEAVISLFLKKQQDMLSALPHHFTRWPQEAESNSCYHIRRSRMN